MDSQELFRCAAVLTEGELSFGPDGESCTITVMFPDGRKQGVELSLVQHRFDFFEQQRVIIHVDSKVGPLNSAIDLEYLFESARKLVMSRVAILDDNSQHIALEGRFPFELATPEILATLILEVAYCADSFEKDLFEVDVF